MKFDFDQALTAEDGQTIKIAEKPGEVMNFRKAAIMALSGTYQDEQSLTGEEKFTRGKIAMNISNEKSPELKIEEVAEVKKCIGKAFTPWLIAQLWDMIDSSPEVGLKEVK